MSASLANDREVEAHLLFGGEQLELDPVGDRLLTAVEVVHGEIHTEVRKTLLVPAPLVLAHEDGAFE